MEPATIDETKKLDKYYTSLLKVTDMDTVVAAGWFDEGRSNGYDDGVQHYTTSLSKIAESEAKEVAVLYYTGCFAPIHRGHLKVMRLAKETVEEQTGLPVVAGYFAPDHDVYSGTKTNNAPEYNAAQRISLIQKDSEEWMQVDSWPSLYAETSLNFTTLYDRFIRYVKKWLPEKNVRVYYVFGGDNYQFANAFIEHGHAVCVPRKGTTMDMTKILPTARTLWSAKESTDDSSTKVRAARKAEEERFYVLRNDLPLAFPVELPTLNRKQLEQKLEELLSAHSQYDVMTVNVLEQLENFVSDVPFISLDCFLPAVHRLQLTRLFQAGDYQRYSKLHTNRAGTPPIEEQLKQIPQGTYDLVDDDIATGATMHAVATMLNQKGIQVRRFRSFLESYGDNVYDILDMRDFVLGAHNGGLSIKTVQGEVTRVMYAAPYVNLVTRAKLTPDAALQFSKQVWKLNEELYAGSGVTVGDIQEHQDYTQFGFSATLPLEQLCRIHARFFNWI